MSNLPILPILIIIPLIGLAFVLLSMESDEFAIQAKKSALWTTITNFVLSLYLSWLPEVHGEASTYGSVNRYPLLNE